MIALAILVSPRTAQAQATASVAPHVATAFFYGERLPQELLAHFDRVVVEPDHVGMVPAPGATRGQLFAYVGVGEVNRSRSWRADIPPSLVLGRNDAWASDIVDTRSPEWRSFLLDRVFEPLYVRGFRGFFLDALDSFRRTTSDPAEVARHLQGMANIVTALKRRHPDAKVILNRGFALLPLLNGAVDGLVAESLFQTASPSGQYAAVSRGDSEALLTALKDARTRYGLPITVVDYVPPTEPELRRRDALRIWQLGFDPWVATPSLDSVGIGRTEIVPRKVMLLYQTNEETFLGVHDAAVLVAPVLEFMGYVVDYVDVRKGLPAGDLSGQYAGIVSFLPDGVDDARAYRSWIVGQLDRGIRIAFLEGFGFNPDAGFLARLGLGPATSSAKGPMRVAKSSAYVGFEAPARPRLHELPSVRVASSRATSQLRIEDAAGAAWDAVVLGTWGGAVLQPYMVEDGIDQERRWILDPFRFLRDALALPPIPAPDVTTESGRRILTAHIDGDAFVSRAERLGSPLAARIILDEVLRKYSIPHTVSIIEGEVGPTGKYSSESPKLEAVARDIFALPNVEIASHTYSHPFEWADAEAGKRGPPLPFLDIPGYRFDLAREIKGSVAYIDQRLAPPGKHVKVLLWPGDCEPSASAVMMAQRLGLFDVNGGGSTRTFAFPSLTHGTPMGIPRGGGAYQVFAPVENENVYTNEWHGPYYGYRNAIETFELNDSPRRLGIISIYYHFYSGAKTAAMTALGRVYGWALRQETTPLYLSEYAAKVLAFQRASLARRIDDGGWEIADMGELQTLRVDPAWGWPDLERSTGVAGVREVPQGRYVSLAKSEGEYVLYPAQDAPTQTHLESANGRVLRWEPRGREVALRISGHVPLSIVVGGAASACTLRTAQGVVQGVHGGSVVRFTLAQTDTGEATLACH